MSIINSQPLIGASGQQGYTIAKSLRFRSSASAYLNRTPASAGNRQIWTFSAWIKRGSLGGGVRIFGARTDANNYEEIWFTSSDTFQWYSWRTSGYGYNKITSAVYRDPSAWYHIVCTYDSTQATASNRQRIYINGVQVTAFSSSTDPSSSASSDINNNVAQAIGTLPVFLGNYFDGYLAEVNFIDGQALTPSSFGETSASTGVWIPKKYTGTYGTNGFYLDFKDTSSVAALGYDAAGSNDWTVNNVSLTSGSTYDSMKDVPTLTDTDTANYAVMNPLIQTSNLNLSNGNLTITGTANYSTSPATFGMSSGKWYWEYTCTTYSASGDTHYGIGTGSFNVYQNTWAGSTSAGWIYSASNGNKYNNNSAVAYGATFTSGDIIGVAFDADVGTLTFYKNNVSQGTAYTGLTSGPYFPVATVGTSNLTNANFGQRPFAYTPPTGFKALNTYNLPTPTIGATASTQANKYFDVSLYTGTGSSQSITNSGSMQPDFVWVKKRSGADNNELQDAVRGATKRLASNTTDAETTVAGSISSFNSNGFTVVNAGTTNENGFTYVGWQWRASNATGVTNTAGSITSTVSANTTAGFSIVTYTGTGANATVGHGLGVAPSMVIVKSRTGGTLNWAVYHTSLGTNNTVFLDSTSGSVSSTQYWNTAPTSSVFGIGTANLTNTNASNFVAYCFAQVAGYSAFGSYTGNGSSDGVFIYTGFRPRYFMVKRTDASSYDWILMDTARDPINVATQELYADLSIAEGTAANNYDILSNGFKARRSNAAVNASGGTYIYMAFAESPFKYSLAR